MLHVSHVNKQFQGTPVLRDVSLTLQEGETVAIIGRSGSGKSTLLRCIHQLERVDSGQILVHGETLVSTVQGAAVYAPPPQARAISMQMGFVFQGYNLFPHWTVLDNLIRPLRMVRGTSKADAAAQAIALLRKVGLEDKGRQYPCQLSGGQQQRVAIARALIMSPRLLSFDEPTSALDPELTREVLGVIRGLAQEKRTMLIVTHEMNFAREVAHRIVFMQEGRVMAEGTPEEVLGQGKTAQVARFLGEDAS